ncbi:MAG TPA: hypothetical protein PKK06_06850 [Phycisphaerae bacterium]|nr:hypothetical protein [Phycisphaerae bacterium]HNU44437.1 hypothetical protein [Phycisphaerae bacterium]
MLGCLGLSGVRETMVERGSEPRHVGPQSLPVLPLKVHSAVPGHPRGSGATLDDRRAPSPSTVAGALARAAATGRRRLALAGAVGTALGLIVALAIPARYPCAATLRVAGSASSDPTDEYRRALLDYTAYRLTADHASAAQMPAWFVDVPEAGHLRLCLLAGSTRVGLQRVRSVAEGFLSHLDSERERLRNTPTAAEDILADRRTRLSAALEQAEKELQAALTQVPASDPRADRAALLTQWQEARAEFARLRENLIEASEGLARVRGQGIPTDGLVSTQQRLSALEGDQALQQDLKELTVQLTLVQRELLRVREQVAPPFDALADAAEQLAEVTKADCAWLSDATAQQQVTQYVEAATSYLSTRAGFAVAWADEFAHLADATVDPDSPVVLDIHERLRSLVADFLFQAAGQLSTLRQVTDALGEGTGDTARYHVLHSDLLRAFQVVQTAHHRFEFAAGALDARGSFRLDAALRGARGLHRRTKARLREIDDQLRTVAVEDARRRRNEQIAEYQRTIEATRTAADATVATILSLQDQLNLTTDLTEDFLRSWLDAELAASRIDLMQQNLSTTDSELDRLAAARTASTEGRLELASCGVMGASVNLPQRLGIGAGAGLGALVLAYLLLLRLAERQ